MSRWYHLWWDATPDERRSMRQTAQVVAPFALLAIVAIATMMWSFTQPLRIAPPLAFSQPSYVPLPPFADGRVCPGDVLRWHVDLTVERAPVMVMSVRSIWDVANNQTAQSAGLDTTGVTFTAWTEKTRIDRESSQVIPALAPGHYEVRSMVQELNTQAAAYVVPFTIVEGCS